MKSKETVVLLIVFIGVCSFLGDRLELFYTIWWWDVMLHFVAGITFAMIGFMLAKRLGKHSISPLFAALFAFTFAVTALVLWEIYEFTVDSLCLTNMQHWIPGTDTAENLGFGGDRQAPGLIDTMKDLIVGSTGALITAVIGGCYLRRKEKAQRTSEMK